MKRSVSMVLTAAMLASMAAGMNAQAEESMKDKYDGKQVVVYGRFMEGDAKWIADTVWPAFKEEYGADVVYKTFENVADLRQMLELDKANGMPTVFMATDSILPELVDADLVTPVSEYDADGSYSALYTDSSLDSFTVDDVQYLTPWSEASYMVIYLKEPVEDAVANWETIKEDVNASLKEYNGYGLPDDYTLEADVNEWDYFDLAVAGYYWAHTEYYGMTSPRIAHRAMRYDATVTELVSKIYQLNGTQDDVLKMDTQPVADMLKWEDYFANQGIYAPEMWLEGWGGGTIYQAMADGGCFLAFMHINDAFTIHGLGTPDSPGYLADASEMGTAVSPMGCSMDIEEGQPAYTGTRSSVKWSWGWGITKDSPDQDLSFELIKWMMTGTDDYISHWEAAGQGTPLKSFGEDASKYLSEDWMIDAYKTASEQAQLSMTAPLVPEFSEVGTVYLDAWYDIVVDQNNGDIQGSLSETYAPKVQEMLK